MKEEVEQQKIKKPSERILEIHKALKVLDGKNPDETGIFYETKAIINYLDEMFEKTKTETPNNN